MAIVVKVAGVDVTVKWMRRTSAGWEDPLNGRGTGRIQFGDVDGGFVPEDGQSFEIIDGGVLAFAGILMEPSQEEPEGSGFIFYDCLLADYNILADRRNVSENFEDVAFEAIVSGIVTRHMDGEGITLGGVETGVNLSSINPNISATESFNAISDATGRPWFIDVDREMNFRARTSISAPSDLDGDMALMGTVKVREDRQKYRNEQIIKAGTEEFPIFVVSGRASEIAARAAIEGTSGIYSNVQTFPEITNPTIAAEKAGDLLDRFGTIGKVVELRTRTPGFRAGQAANVFFPKHGINNETLLIDNVTAEVVTVDSGGGDDEEIWYTIRAITGDPFGGWMEHYRKAPPVIGPLRFQNEPGLFRVIPSPGVVIHDPLPGPFEWFQGPTSVPTKFPSVFGVTNDGLNLFTVRTGGLANTDGCGGGLFPGFGGSPACFVNRQTIVEIYTIDPVTREVGTVPFAGNSIDRPSVGSNYKAAAVFSPDDRYAAFVLTNTPSVDSVLVIYDLDANVFRGQAVTSMPTNGNLSEPIWVGDHVYFVGGDDDVIYVFDCSDVDNPVETDAFTTSVTSIRSLVASPDGSALYGSGALDVAAFDRSDPDNLVEDTVLTPGGAMASLAISDAGTELISFFRLSGSEVGYNSWTVSVNDTDLAASTTAGIVPLATSVMEGLANIWRGATAIVFSETPSGPANSFEAHVFDATDIDAVTLVESFAYNHGTVSNQGPFRSIEPASSYVFFGGVTQQITFGEPQFEEPVPLTIDNPLRAGFGGTGVGDYFPGDILFADRVLPDDTRGHGELTRLAIESFGDVLTVSGALPNWLPFSGLADFYGIGGGGGGEQVLFTDSDLLVTSGALVAVPGLEATVSSGTTYYFRSEMFVEAETALGHGYAIGGTAAGDVRYQVRVLDDDTGEYSIIVSGQKSALDEEAGVAAIATSGTQRAYTEISGTIDVTADGTIVPKFGVF